MNASTSAAPRRVRTPTRLQMEATECGAAALAIVLEHHGAFVPLSQLRQECGVSRDGSKASNLLKAARRYGLRARGLRRNVAGLRQLPPPVIVHWQFNHFVVVEGFGKNKVYLNDPAVGPRVVNDGEFDRSFTGIALELEPTSEFLPGARRPSLLPGLLRRLVGSSAALAFVVACGAGLIVPALAIPVFGKVFVDAVLIGGHRDWLPGLLIGMAITAVLRALLTALQRGVLLKLVTKLAVSMSTAFTWHALRLPVTFFSARSLGDLVGRVQLNDAVANLLSSQFAGVILDLLQVVFYVALMLYFDPWLSALALGTALLHAILLKLADRTRTDLQRAVIQEEAKVAGVAAGGLSMIETLKASGAESDFFARWAGQHTKLMAAQQNLARREQWLSVAASVLSRVHAVLLLGFGALRVMDGDLTIGTLVAFQSLSASFLAPIEGLAAFGAAFQQLRGTIERLDDVLGHAPDPRTVAREPVTASTPLTGALELEEVSFGYLPFAAPLLEKLSLRVAPGQRVALVGGTGSGKSTVAQLVCGLHEPWSGRVKFDGRTAPELPRAALASALALVDQSIALFEGSVRDNITLWDDSISEADVVQAARDACIHDDIARLPGGYDAHLIEGGFNFSGGQRQRLEIARALARRPALIVLDEATSALDAETERQIDDNLRRRGCSCLIIAHRLSTIRDADEIIVLERGQVVQRGSHRDLVELEGKYRDLVAAL